MRVRAHLAALAALAVASLPVSARAEALWLIILSVVSGAVGLLADVGPGPTQQPAIRNFQFDIPTSPPIHVGDRRKVLFTFDADLGDVCPDASCFGEGDVTVAVTQDGGPIFRRRWTGLRMAQVRFDPGDRFLAWGTEPGQTTVEAQAVACGDDQGGALAGTAGGLWTFPGRDRYACTPASRITRVVSVDDPFTDAPDPPTVEVNHGQRAPQRVTLQNASTACGFVPFPLAYSAGADCFESDPRVACLDQPGLAERAVAKAIARGTESAPSNNDLTPGDCRDPQLPVYDRRAPGHVDVRDLPAVYSFRAVAKWRMFQDGTARVQYWSKRVERSFDNRCRGGPAWTPAVSPSPAPTPIPPAGGTVEITPRDPGTRGAVLVPPPAPRVASPPGMSVVLPTDPAEAVVVPDPAAGPFVYTCREAPRCESCCFAVHVLGPQASPTGYERCVREECGDAPSRAAARFQYRFEEGTAPATAEVRFAGDRFYLPQRVEARPGTTTRIMAAPRPIRPMEGTVRDDGGRPLSGRIYRPYRYHDVYPVEASPGHLEYVASFTGRDGGRFRIEGTMLEFADEETLVFRLHPDASFATAYAQGPEQSVQVSIRPQEAGDDSPLGIPDVVFRRAEVPAPRVTVRGLLVTPNRRPAAGVRVSILEAETRRVVAAAATDARGVLSLVVPAGRHLARVESETLPPGIRSVPDSVPLPFGSFGDTLDLGVVVLSGSPAVPRSRCGGGGAGVAIPVALALACWTRRGRRAGTLRRLK
jgi:hypothetical protein